MSAHAVWFTAPRHVEVRPIPAPNPHPGDLVIRTLYSGISAGTELLAYRGELNPATERDETLTALADGGFEYPFQYGYSCVGVVEQGPDALRGATVFAFHPHQDRFVASEGDVVVLPETTDPRVATLFPLVETALQLSLDAGPVLEDTVVVTGLGAIGLLTSLLLTRAGARVVATEPEPWRRERAAEVGIRAVAPGEAPTNVPLLVETSGAPAALADGLALLAHEGTALVGSWYGTKPVPLPLGEHFHRRRLTIRSSQVSTIPFAAQGRWTNARRRTTARDLLGTLPLTSLATSEYALRDAADAYAALDRREPGVLHAALRYDERN
ncbi:zinc-dependent alcohol dehydrogenase [Cryptosporangium aurantiacum]|uniref:2-desacetyl-2-hydroxyethyl bacteriochlorophyllide A dehydrogenase n=1 Tax=Cryptosporangium aurantiacum TaxID=134849 RepID=A0A1M7RLI6_9ACTN|nr:zinc-binding alcohol dehydrogenase [Cryptosporangium aurantiacum]SHN47040.1 2-desacetyl-2-hydroxyethyl bacteriochlorophyllide A dehydrogenase [Cryptosporangium aurantiacum]